MGRHSWPKTLGQKEWEGHKGQGSCSVIFPCKAWALDCEVDHVSEGQSRSAESCLLGRVLWHWVLLCAEAGEIWWTQDWRTSLILMKLKGIQDNAGCIIVDCSFPVILCSIVPSSQELAALEEMSQHNLLSSRAALENGWSPWRGCGGPKQSDVCL